MLERGVGSQQKLLSIYVFASTAVFLKVYSKKSNYLSHLLKIQIPGPHSRPSELELSGGGSWNWQFKSF